MAALSLTATSAFRSRSPIFPTPARPRLATIRPLRAIQFPSPTPSPPGELYQPYRPPPSPLPPRYSSLSTVERIDVLRNRLGLWHEYAPLVSALEQEGFNPPTIEAVTGISGVEQNRLAVAVQVRDSLVSSEVPPDVLAFFDLGGAELLYEIRFLSAQQRAAAARYIVERRIDPSGAQRLARAVKDFPLRLGDPGWDCFSGASPADCMAYVDFRLSREAISVTDRVAALGRALEEAETEAARKRITDELRRAEAGAEEGADETVGPVEEVRLPVVRLRYGEVAETTSVVLLPVCEAVEGAGGVVAAPACRVEGDFGVVAAEKGWGRWVVLPGWAPVMGVRLGGGVVVAFPDSRSLPWRLSRRDKQEPVLVVVDREKRAVAGGGGFYLIAGEGGRLAVERGDVLSDKGVAEAVATVVLVVRPPREDTSDQIADEEWD